MAGPSDPKLLKTGLKFLAFRCDCKRLLRQAAAKALKTHEGSGRLPMQPFAKCAKCGSVSLFSVSRACVLPDVFRLKVRVFCEAIAAPWRPECAGVARQEHRPSV